MSYNKKCRWFSMEYVGNPGAVPACNRDAVLEAFDCSTCKENQINANPTNADRIRSMSDEELSELIGDNIDCCICKKEIFQTTECPGSILIGEKNCYGVWLEWLKQEAD